MNGMSTDLDQLQKYRPRKVGYIKLLKNFICEELSSSKPRS